MRLCFPPQVFLIGAMKSGTTSLAHMLDQHPDISVAKPKEPHYFTQNYEHGLEWYLECFSTSRGKRLCVDASTSYTYAPVAGVCYSEENMRRLSGVPQRIAKLSPNAKFIYILREPVSRTYSMYQHNIRSGWETRKFRQAIAEHAQYLSVSRYLDQYIKYLECFPRDSFQLLLFEELKRDPVGVAKSVFAFLEVEQDVDIELEQGKNPGYQYSRVGTLLRKIGLIDALSNVIPNSAKRMLAPVLTKKMPPMGDDDRLFLQSYFSPLNKQLSEFTGLDLTLWGEY